MDFFEKSFQLQEEKAKPKHENKRQIEYYMIVIMHEELLFKQQQEE
jgi:hypothetical protein